MFIIIARTFPQWHQTGKSYKLHSLWLFLWLWEWHLKGDFAEKQTWQDTNTCKWYDGKCVGVSMCSVWTGMSLLHPHACKWTRWLELTFNFQQQTSRTLQDGVCSWRISKLAFFNMRHLGRFYERIHLSELQILIRSGTEDDAQRSIERGKIKMKKIIGWVISWGYVTCMCQSLIGSHTMQCPKLTNTSALKLTNLY